MPQANGSIVSRSGVANIRLDREFDKKIGIDLSKKDHDYYFGSYSSFYIHEEMLKDTVRTRAY